MTLVGVRRGQWSRVAAGVAALAFAAVLAGILGSSPVPAAAADDVRRPAPALRKRQPPERIKDLTHFLAARQEPDGGWLHRVTIPVDDVRRRPRKEAPPFQRVPSVPDTAAAGLALMRAGNTTRSGAHRENVHAAAEFLYRAVAASDPKTLTVEKTPTALSARIGHYADSALALLFFAELRDPVAPDVRYDGVMVKLVDKLQKNQKPDGSWGGDVDGASHAPLLGHALALWALETAYRNGVDGLDPAVLAKAGQYALSDAAVRADERANGKWKQDGRAAKPDWLVRAGVDDDEPINHEVYRNAARLCVLAQTERSNRHVLQRELRIASPKRAAQLRQSAARTREALDAAAETIRGGWIKIHERDLHPSPAPLFFTGEDFLATLMVVDAMAGRRDVVGWFPPVVRRLMYFQDPESGAMRTDKPVLCEVLSKDVRCGCEEQPLFPDNTNDLERMDRKGPRMGLELPAPDTLGAGASTVRGGGNPGCPAQRSWTSRDNTFITAAAVMTLLADTPYRPAFLGEDQARRAHRSR